MNWCSYLHWSTRYQIDWISYQEHVILFLSEQEQAKDVVDAKKKKKTKREIESIEIHDVYECVPDMGQKYILKMGDKGEFPGQ